MGSYWFDFWEFFWKSVVSIRFCGFCDLEFLNLKNKITERIAPPIKTIATIIPPTIPPTFVVFEDFDPGDVVVVCNGNVCSGDVVVVCGDIAVGAV